VREILPRAAGIRLAAFDVDSRNPLPEPRRDWIPRLPHECFIPARGG